MATLRAAGPVLGVRTAGAPWAWPVRFAYFATYPGEAGARKWHGKATTSSLGRFGHGVRVRLSPHVLLAACQGCQSPGGWGCWLAALDVDGCRPRPFVLVGTSTPGLGAAVKGAWRSAAAAHTVAAGKTFTRPTPYPRLQPLSARESTRGYPRITGNPSPVTLRRACRLVLLRRPPAVLSSCAGRLPSRPPAAPRCPAPLAPAEQLLSLAAEPSCAQLLSLAAASSCALPARCCYRWPERESLHVAGRFGGGEWVTADGVGCWEGRRLCMWETERGLAARIRTRRQDYVPVSVPIVSVIRGYPPRQHQTESRLSSSAFLKGQLHSTRAPSHLSYKPSPSL
ncbi:hypothetical protein HU200_049777 [Digitaria exilis]|uniref:Uncharacterized protein n=1 Tax=Digitaria exilis TaxID=1010633 RepID=A0A835B3Z2_9POAL|nr:hypothetical protein HU200_049777 [Digitaria exilis]